MHSVEAIKKVLTLDFTTVLDIGSGGGDHADRFRNEGKQVTTIDLRSKKADYQADYLKFKVKLKPFDCVWASHVLEHQPNPNQFLKKCFSDLKDGGILAVTVPPLKHEIVGGHVTLWNAGLLLYHLILAGFDCRDAMVKAYGYNISVIVRKVKADLPELMMDCGDIEKLKEFFPFNAYHGFEGRISEVNW